MAGDMENPDGGKIDNKLLLATLRDIRREQRETKRLAKRIDDVKDDLEIMLKSELLGSLSLWERVRVRGNTLYNSDVYPSPGPRSGPTSPTGRGEAAARNSVL
jgi:hypothetical protein